MRKKQDDVLLFDLFFLNYGSSVINSDSSSFIIAPRSSAIAKLSEE